MNFINYTKIFKNSDQYLANGNKQIIVFNIKSIVYFKEPKENLSIAAYFLEKINQNAFEF